MSVNNKRADQIARVCTSVVRIQQSQDFSRLSKFVDTII